VRVGKTAAARATLESLLRSFSGDRDAQSLLAQLELMSGSAARAVELYSGLVRRSPRLVDLSNLGFAYLLLGRYGEAAASFRRAVALAPGSAAVVLNLADAELLQGRRREAEALYARVLELAARDPAAGFWNTLSIEAQAFAHLGRSRDAVAAIQKALRAAPDNPQAAYEAALVYAMVGETASAQVLAERALAGGVERRWFDFPWFAPLRLPPASAGS
jgi:serine/threonine-protein kinase